MCIRPMAWRWRARSAMPPMLAAPIRRGSKHSMPMSGCVRNCRRQRPTRRYRRPRRTRRFRRAIRRFRPQRQIRRLPPTNTTVLQTLTNTRAIAAVRLSSANPGELSVEWDAPGEPARDYRVSWAKVGEAFRTWTDLDYNAFPTTASLTISGLEGGSRYKVMVRARYIGGAGPWTGEVEAMVMDEESLPPTNTAIPPTNTAGCRQRTHLSRRQIHLVPPTNTLVPPTNTLVPDVGPREIEFVLLNGDPNGAYGRELARALRVSGGLPD